MSHSYQLKLSFKAPEAKNCVWWIVKGEKKSSLLNFFISQLSYFNGNTDPIKLFMVALLLHDELNQSERL